MSEPAAFVAWTGDVRDEWVDYNGHLTDWAYAAVCAQANEAFLDSLDLGAAYLRQTGCSVYTVQCRLRYLAEVRAGARVMAETVLVAADAKRLLVHTTVSDEAATVVLTGEYVFLHHDQRSGRVVELPADRAATVDAVLRAHSSWPRPPHLGSGVSLRRS